MNVGSTTLDRSMPGLTCFMRNQTMDLFSSLNSSVWSPVWMRNIRALAVLPHTHRPEHFRRILSVVGVGGQNIEVL